MNRLFPIFSLIVLPCLLLLSGCRTTSAVAGAAALPSAEGILDRDFPEWVEPEPGPSLVTKGTDRPVLTSREAVRLALTHSRSLASLYDVLEGNALTLRSARRGLSWDASLGAEWNRDIEGETDGTGTFSVEDTLDTGASVQLRSSYDLDDALLDTDQGNARLRLDQPLLKGIGYTRSHETLIQAERSLRYQMRTFEFEREEVLLEVVSAYYELINQFAVLENTRRNLEQSVFLRQRSEEVFEVQKATYLDVLRAQQQELSASNSLENAQADVLTAKKTFMVQLGLDPSTVFDVETDPPSLQFLAMEEEALIRVGLAWRRDLRSSRERIEDAERRVALARNGLLPEVNIFAQAEGFLEQTEVNENGVASGLSLEIPLQRQGLHDGLREAEIDLEVARRNHIETEADAQIELLRRRNEINNFRRNVVTARRNVDIAKRQLEFSIIRFEDGTLPNRDVVEAQEDLLTAENSLVRALVSHELERLQLLQSAGCLLIEADGNLKPRDIPGMVWFTRENEVDTES